MLKEKILEYLNNADAHDLISIHNEYCGSVNAYDDYIYSMEDIDELCAGQDAYWIACRAIFGDFNAMDDYITFNGYGNFVTLNEYSIKHHVFIDDIVDYIVENNDSLYNDDIQDILDEHDAIEKRAAMEAKYGTLI